MSKYTTGEIAALCDVTVRTVQYYDSRNILVPGELTEGGRRLYNDDDVKRLKIICFLKDLGLSLNAISELLREEHPENVLDLLLQQQEEVLKKEIADGQKKLSKLEQLKHEIKTLADFSVESLGDIALVMENKKKLRKVRAILFGVGIPLNLAEIASILLWIFTGIWWPFVLWLIGDIILGAILIRYYYRHVAYICPQCHNVFRPIFKEFFWGKHTTNTRKCTCTHCGHHGYCVETYGEDSE